MRGGVQRSGGWVGLYKVVSGKTTKLLSMSAGDSRRKEEKEQWNRGLLRERAR